MSRTANQNNDTECFLCSWQQATKRPDSRSGAYAEGGVLSVPVLPNVCKPACFHAFETVGALLVDNLRTPCRQVGTLISKSSAQQPRHRIPGLRCTASKDYLMATAASSKFRRRGHVSWFSGTKTRIYLGHIKTAQEPQNITLIQIILIHTSVSSTPTQARSAPGCEVLARWEVRQHKEEEMCITPIGAFLSVQAFNVHKTYTPPTE